MARGLHVRLIDNLDLMDNLCFSHVGTRDSSLFLFGRLLRFFFFYLVFVVWVGGESMSHYRVRVENPVEKKREKLLAGSDNENKKLLFS